MVELTMVMGLQLGDEGKGSVVSDLARSGKFTHCARGQGGQNAGHQVYKDGVRYTTHIVPSGALYGLPSIIGSECYLNEDKFLKEIEELSKGNSNISNLVKISKNTHIVKNSHIDEEDKETKIGTTRQGIGPCARDKYSRTGIRAENVKTLQSFVVDVFDEFYNKNKDAKILFEGAQSYWLDISHGDYPFVTASHCGIGAFLNNGFNHKQIKQVIGVVKAYTTYVGSKEYQNREDNNLDRICDAGSEYGSTTGRKRQVGYFDVDQVRKAIEINGVDRLIIKKVDILRSLGIWKVLNDGELLDLKTEENFIEFLSNSFPYVKKDFSYTPLGI